MGLIYLVRHASTAWNRERRYQGSRDVPLDAEGRRQARRLAERLRGVDWDAVWCSDLARARQTLDIIAPAASPRFEPGFREIGFGAWEGLTSAEVRARYPDEYAAYRDGGAGASAPGGESPAAVADRSLSAFRRLWRPDYRRVLLVSHGAVLKALMLRLVDADLSLRTRIVVDNASLSVVRLGPGPARLLKLNDTAHLEPDRRRSRPAGPRA